MAGKIINDRVRVIVGLNAAAFMCWVETRKGKTPSSHDIQQYIKGQLDAEGFTYDADEPKIIELVAIATSSDTVDRYIKESGFFEDFDQAMRLTGR
jgi:hypothetical protein